MIFFVLLGIPIILSIWALFAKNTKTFGIFNALGYGLLTVFSVVLNYKLSDNNISYLSLFYIDALSGYFILLTSIISFASAVYSIDYIEHNLIDNTISKRESKFYYALFNLFTLTMFFTTIVNNLGIVWVSIEMTTLTSAFLVGFYNNEKSIEAAWKYVIICSVGIALALLGTILFYYAVSTNGGLHSLNWTDMVSVASKLDPKVLKIAFLFIIVGYGTKAGISPMHTWLPDAHSQAVTPVSALLSGVLLKTALYAILRFMVIINKSLSSDYTGNLLIFFGLSSLGVAAVFVLVQKDIKRLLAYSSIEHIGIILIGLGIGGQLGYYGALFHIFNHAVTKSLMFLGAGSIVQKYKTHNMSLIRGVIKTMPFIGFFVLLGTFALSGIPPFSLFMSEIMILISGFTKGYYFTVAVFLLLIAVIFGAIINHFTKMIFGMESDNMLVVKEKISTKFVFIFLTAFIVILGISMPGFFDNILKSAVKVLLG